MPSSTPPACVLCLCACSSTLLVDQPTRRASIRGALKSLQQPRGVRNSVRRFHRSALCQGAVSAESDLDAAVTESTLRVAVVPAESGSAGLNESAEDQIAAEFQPLLLEYRLRNHRAVSQSTFDVPEFSPGLRDLARSLGAAIVDDAELAGRIAPLLAPQDADARARRSVLPEGAILTVGLALVHEAKLKQMLTKALTQLVNAVLRANGEIVEYSPEEVGWRLAGLGLYTHRMAGGNGIRFDRGFSRSVHNLARRSCAGGGHSRRGLTPFGETLDSTLIGQDDEITSRAERAITNISCCDRGHGKAAHLQIQCEALAPSATAKHSTGSPGL